MTQPQPNPGQPPFDYRAQVIDKWLENLPRASVGKSAEMVYKALQSLYLQPIKAADRFATLEKMREIVHYICSNMRKHFAGLTYPLPDKVMMIASACQAMNDYMAKGYTQVFHELQKQSFLFVDRKMLVTTIHRAITYLHRSLLIAYEIYAAYHHDYWEQLHELYHYAEIHKLAQQTVGDNYLITRKKSNIIDEYLRATLLFMAEPYHLRPGEIWITNQHIEHWFELTSIEPVHSKEELELAGKLVIELNKDHPPQYTGTHVISSDISQCRVIDTQKLLLQLNVELQQMIAEQQGKHRPTITRTIGVGLLQRLIESWGHNKRRRYPRQQVFAKINVTVGLHNTHMQLMYEQYINDTSGNKSAHSGFKKPKYESIEIKDVRNEQTDVWSTVYAWAASNTNNTPKAIPSEQDDILEYRVKQDNWTMLNESANGFALMSVERQANKIQVGEIISIQRAGSKTREIGIVRWLKAYGNTGVEIGCMFLAPSAIPVGIMTDDKKSSDKIVNRGLLLPMMSVLNRPESIMTFSRQYRVNDEIYINQPGKPNYGIRLTRRLADNDTVSQFLFTRVEHQLPLQNPDESSTEIDIQRFQDVWKNI